MARFWALLAACALAAGCSDVAAAEPPDAGADAGACCCAGDGMAWDFNGAFQDKFIQVMQSLQQSIDQLRTPQTPIAIQPTTRSFAFKKRVSNAQNFTGEALIGGNGFNRLMVTSTFDVNAPLDISIDTISPQENVESNAAQISAGIPPNNTFPVLFTLPMLQVYFNSGGNRDAAISQHVVEIPDNTTTVRFNVTNGTGQGIDGRVLIQVWRQY